VSGAMVTASLGLGALVWISGARGEALSAGSRWAARLCPLFELSLLKERSVGPTLAYTPARMAKA